MRTGKADGMGVIQPQSNSNSIVVNLQAARMALSPECAFGKGTVLQKTGKYLFSSNWKAWALRMVYWRKWKSVDNNSENENDNSDMPYFPTDYISDKQSD